MAEESPRHSIRCGVEKEEAREEDAHGLTSERANEQKLSDYYSALKIEYLARLPSVVAWRLRGDHSKGVFWCWLRDNNQTKWTSQATVFHDNSRMHGTAVNAKTKHDTTIFLSSVSGVKSSPNA